MNTKSLGVAFSLAAILATSVAAPSAFAKNERGMKHEKHDSNTLHKLGNAIQYPFRKLGENTSKTAHKAGKATEYATRKGGENASVAAHEATGRKSVELNRKNHTEKVVTASGKDIPIANTHYTHRKIRHHKMHH